MAPTQRYYVISSPEHASKVFPQPEREGMREAIAEVMDRNGVPVVVGLSPGKFHVYPVQNEADFEDSRDRFDGK